MALPRIPGGRALGSAPLVAASALALVALTAPAANGAAPMAYFSIGPDVYRAVLDGTSPAERVTGTSHSLYIRGIALDPAHGRLFTSRASNPAIETASLTPGDALAVVPVSSPGLANPGGISIDPTAGRIYWGTEGVVGNTGNVLSADVTGANTTTIGTPGTGDKRVLGLAVDPGTHTVWWPQYTPSPAINWTRTDGSAHGTLDTTGASLNAPKAIAISHRSDRVYWANFLNIGSASLSGGGGTDFPSAMGPGGVAVDDAAGHLYWMETANITQEVAIKRTGLDGQGTVSVTPPGPPAGGTDGLALLWAPVQATGTTLTGTGALGDTLACSAATWAGDAPESFAFRAPATTTVQWARDGQPIAAATDATYRVTEAGRYTCLTIATNAAGSTTATSDGIAVSAPTPATPGTPSGGGNTAVGRLSARWTLRGRAVTTTFRVPTGANRFAITATRRGSRSAPARGRCRVGGTARARAVTCSLRLAKGSWTATVTASRGSTPVSRTSRTITVRTLR